MATTFKRGSKWNRPDRIEPVTDSIRTAIRKNKLAHQMNGLDFNFWNAMDIETLETVSKFVWKE